MLAVMLGVMLARFAGMVRRVRRMTVRRMGMVRGFLVRISLMMLGCFAMMLGGVFVMVGRFLVVLDDLVFGHADLHEDGCRSRLGRPGARRP